MTTATTASRRRRRSGRSFVAVVAGVAAALATGVVDASSGEQHAGVAFTLGEVNAEIGADHLHRTGLTGAGITVAVIDTGVEPVPGLDAPGKLMVGPDLSFEAGVPELYGHDTYGHGTVMASIIAGNDGVQDGFVGVAPDAQILSVKVADNTGAVDVSQVIAAIDWVIAHRDSAGMNVRVLNLSYRTDSEQPYEIDPLAAAVERAWNAGIVVVAAAGNDGEVDGRLGNPARDPFVLAVAAHDEGYRGSASPFSSLGDERHPDLVAPGSSVLGVAAPGSRLAQTYPSAFLDGRFLRGSGTSQAAAVTSGAVALLLQRRPELTPDQVKALMILSADEVDDSGTPAPVVAGHDIHEFLEPVLDDAAAANLAAAQAAERTARTRHDELTTVRSKHRAVLDEFLHLAGAEADSLLAAAEVRLDDDLGVGAGPAALAISDVAARLAAASTDAASTFGDVRVAAGLVSSARAELAAARHAYDQALAAWKAAQPTGSRSAKRRGDAEPDRLWAEVVAAADRHDRAKEVLKQANRTKDVALARTAYAVAGAEVAADAVDRELEALTKRIEDAVRAVAAADKELRVDKPARRAKRIEEYSKDWKRDKLKSVDLDKVVGAGRLNVERAVRFRPVELEQRHQRSDGSGSLEAARGSDHVMMPDGTLLRGEVTFTGSSWPGTRWSGTRWSGSSWSGESWAGSVWSGSSWSGTRWSGSSWSGESWSGTRWSANSWSGTRWSADAWSGTRWSGTRWSGTRWSGNAWAGSSWSGAAWS